MTTTQTTTQVTTPTTTPTTTLTVQLAVRATPEQVWGALTDGAVTPAYYLGFEAHYGDLSVGESYAYTAGGGDMITGEVLESQPGRRLRATFEGHWAPDVAALPTSVVTFSIVEPPMPMPGVIFLSCVHEGLPEGETARQLELGWVAILSGLKTLLETGAPMIGPPA
ncbi:SRPBCC domain-containing protein [Nocardioides aequoreus]|uniref:SRPBCC domain-containing protein n=1 Tax=Nocardioides aequoreus TaxID=397278 RepID=UPI001470061A|nr:SRPBCC domain-containing protein [Nocardioides aequoreus]